MNAEIQERFQDAVLYDQMMAKVFPGYDLVQLLILSALRTKLGPRARVLDVGCGTGTFLMTCAHHQPEWSLVGVDPTEPLLSLARAKAADVTAPSRVSFATGSVDALPSDERFDAATMILVEHLIPDDGAKARLLQEVATRLPPGGWFVLAGLHGDFASAATNLSLDAWMELIALRGLPRDVQENVRRKAATEDAIVPVARLMALLDEAGFETPQQLYQAQLFDAWLARRA